MKCLCDVFLHVYACLYMMMHDVVFCMFPMCDDEYANLECHYPFDLLHYLGLWEHV